MDTSQASSPIVKEAARRLRETCGATAVWLFGSRARGDEGPDSDYDFLVIVPADEESRYRRAIRARRAVADIRIPKDILVLTQSEWQRDVRVPSSLASIVLREGVKLE